MGSSPIRPTNTMNKQHKFTYGETPPLELLVCRNNSMEPEVWKYDDVVQIRSDKHYITVFMKERSAIIPKAWVVGIRPQEEVSTNG